MKIGLSLGILVVLMISTSILYFLFAIYGESMENNNILLGEGQNETQVSNDNDLHTESPEIEKENSSSQISHEEGSEELENENISLQNSAEDSSTEVGHENIDSSSREMHVLATPIPVETETGEIHNEAGEIHNEAGEIHNEAQESTKGQIETPILLIIGIVYLLLAISLIIYRASSNIPFIVIIIGSGFLIGMYIVSRTIGIPQIGIEHVGPFDLLTNLFQVGIIASSLYLLKAKRQ